MGIRSICTVLWLAVLCSASSRAASLEETAKVLDVIEVFSTRFCGNPNLKGNQSTQEVQAKVGAETKTLVQALGTVKLEGGGKWQNSQYQGLLQKDMITALQSATQCKERLFKDLVARLLPAQTSDAANAQQLDVARPMDLEVSWVESATPNGTRWIANYVFAIFNVNSVAARCVVEARCVKIRADTRQLLEAYPRRQHTALIEREFYKKESGAVVCEGVAADGTSLILELEGQRCTKP